MAKSSKPAAGKKQSPAYRVKSLRERTSRIKSLVMSVDTVVNDYFDWRIDQLEAFEADMKGAFTPDRDDQIEDDTVIILEKDDDEKAA